MKFSELHRIGKGEDAIREIQRHTETLRTMLIAATDRAEHYLLWTNGGAVVALLSFMAASERIRTLPAARHALMFFVVGVISCGVLCALNYHIRLAAFQRWNADTDQFLANATEHTAMYDNLNRLVKGVGSWLPVLFGYIAFGCFIGGAVVALGALPSTS